MNTFVSAVASMKSEEISRTENGMKAFRTTDSALVDLFSKIGSARNVNLSDLFAAAFAENAELATRILLWSRDVREGAGNRKVFRDLLSDLERYSMNIAEEVIPLIPELGRWDDLFAFSNPLIRAKALEYYISALTTGNKLAAKWAPRELSASKIKTPGHTQRNSNAKALRKALGMTSREYRQFLSNLTSVVETQMCEKKWSEIEFSAVPSVASARYQKAFGKNAPVQYAAYIAELQKPSDERTVKINASAIFPHDVVKSIYKGNAAVASAQFDALPNYIGDATILPVVDVSGSMERNIGGNVSAMEVALSLGLYCSHHTTSAFKDMFMTFSDRPKIQTLKGNLEQKMQQLSRSEWSMSTNLHAVFTELLYLAVSKRVAPEDMPSKILILSDMQFNSCVRYDDSAIQMIRRKYEEAGYTIPTVVFWDLVPRKVTTPVKANEKGVILVSGFSPSILGNILGMDPETYSPYNVMMETIMKKRYDYVNWMTH